MTMATKQTVEILAPAGWAMPGLSLLLPRMAVTATSSPVISQHIRNSEDEAILIVYLGWQR